jgi:hypothetical protein
MSLRDGECLLCCIPFTYAACGRPRKFCSIRCQVRHFRGHGPVPPPLCEHCGAKFARKPGRGKLQRFCTPQCQRRQMNGCVPRRRCKGCANTLHRAGQVFCSKSCRYRFDRLSRAHLKQPAPRVKKLPPPIAALPKRLPARWTHLQEDYEQERLLAELTGVRFSVREFVQRNTPTQEFGSDFLDVLNAA